MAEPTRPPLGDSDTTDTTGGGYLYAEEVLDGRLVVQVKRGQWGKIVIYTGSLGNRAGSMGLSPLELAALLDGPLARALEAANKAASG